MDSGGCISGGYCFEECPPVRVSYVALPDVDDIRIPDFIYRDGIREASMRHDALAKRKYYKPFKSFKFNRARRQRP